MVDVVRGKEPTAEMGQGLLRIQKGLELFHFPSRVGSLFEPIDG